MEPAAITPEIPASIAFLSLLEISMRVWQHSQLVAEKLLSSTNFLNEIRPPQPGQEAVWVLDIGFRFCVKQFLVQYKTRNRDTGT